MRLSPIQPTKPIGGTQSWSRTRSLPEATSSPFIRNRNIYPQCPGRKYSAWFSSSRKREQPDPATKEQHTIWPTPHRENSPNLDVYNVIRKQSEADLAEPRPDLKNSSFRVCSGEATPDDDVTCDYDNVAVNPSESGFMTLASMESGFVTNDIYEFSPDRMGRSKESGWVENEIYYWDIWGKLAKMRKREAKASYCSQGKRSESWWKCSDRFLR